MANFLITLYLMTRFRFLDVFSHILYRMRRYAGIAEAFRNAPVITL